MNELQLFTNEEFGEIRVIEINDEPWFIGKDIVTALGYEVNNTTSYTKYVNQYCDEEDIKNYNKETQFQYRIELDYKELGQRGGLLINEYALYDLTFESPLPGAKKFKRWVTHEVLPQIRQTGGYIPLYEDEDVDAFMAKAYMIAQKTLEKKNKLIKNMQPKADYFDALVDRSLLTNFRDTAKELHIRQKDFINWLLENNFIYRDSNNKIKPTAQAIEEGLFELKEFTTEHFSSNQTLVTPKGRETFRLLLEKNKLM